MKKFLTAAFVFLLTACAPIEYLKDWQSMEAPQDVGSIITIPEFPEAGRAFEVRRISTSTRRDRIHLKTPPDGYIEQLKVADSNGTLEFWREGKLIHAIRLGKCFSFAMMDINHDFAAQGSPAYFTAPPDCKIWDDRKWHQTYRTLVVGWRNPCAYESKRVARVYKQGNSSWFRSYSSIHMTMEKDWSTYDWSSVVEYDAKMKFFKMFDVEYVGKVEVLREIK